MFPSGTNIASVRIVLVRPWTSKIVHSTVPVPTTLTVTFNPQREGILGGPSTPTKSSRNGVTVIDAPVSKIIGIPWCAHR
jgi:hypothetical protein